MLNIFSKKHHITYFTLYSKGAATLSDIAKRLVCSPNMVPNHVSKIFGKLQITGRVQATLQARQAGSGKDE